jgi:hypothetical protein
MIEYMKRTSPKFKVGKASREDLDFKKQNEFKPPPNCYNPNMKFVKS